MEFTDSNSYKFLQKNVKFLQVFTKFYLNLKVSRGGIPTPWHFTSYKFLHSWLNSYKVCTNLRTYMDCVSDVLSRRLLETPQNAETSYRHLHTKCQHCFDACGDSHTPIEDLPFAIWISAFHSKILRCNSSRLLLVDLSHGKQEKLQARKMLQLISNSKVLDSCSFQNKWWISKNLPDWCSRPVPLSTFCVLFPELPH